jgi:hypothetical protein
VVNTEAVLTATCFSQDTELEAAVWHSSEKERPRSGVSEIVLTRLVGKYAAAKVAEQYREIPE